MAKSDILPTINDYNENLYTLFFHSMKLEVPKFDGTDPGRWLFRIDKFFDFHKTPEAWRLRLVSYHMEGRADDWFLLFTANRLLSTWSEFRYRLQHHFGSSVYEEHQAALSRPLQMQVTPLANSESPFKVLMNKVTAGIENKKSEKDKIRVQDAILAGGGEQVEIQVPIEKVGFKIGKGGEPTANLETRSLDPSTVTQTAPVTIPFRHLKPSTANQSTIATTVFPHLKPQSYSIHLPPPKQTPSQPSFEEFIHKIEAKIAATVATPLPQPEPSNDTQVVTTTTLAADLQTLSQELSNKVPACLEETRFEVKFEMDSPSPPPLQKQVATNIVVVPVNPCETEKFACGPESSRISNARKVFDDLTERKLSSWAQSACLTLGEPIHDFMEAKKMEINVLSTAKLDYHFEKKSNEAMLVFDPGGGSFDVSSLEVGDSLFYVFPISRDKHLGGDKWDRRIDDWLVCKVSLLLVKAGIREANSTEAP